jgi:hypothetical protein
VETVFSGRFRGRGRGRGRGRIGTAAVVAFALACTLPVGAADLSPSAFVCESGETLATGRPDADLFAGEASKGVRAFWCERYDAIGIATRAGPYWETYSNGRTRTKANYVDSRLDGPVAIRHEDGSLFLRGFLKAGEWSGPLEIFHDSGSIWFAARFESGRLEGALRTHFPDGALESETRYQSGREDGLARSFYPTAAGGRLKSEAHVEADRLVGRHRLLDRRGNLIRLIDWDTGPAAWRSVPATPASADLARPAPATSAQELDLRD